MRKKHRISGRLVMLPIIEILQNYSGVEKGLSNLNIREKLKNEYEYDFTRNAMRDVLNQLRGSFHYGGEIKCSESQRGKSQYTYNYYFEPYISEAELQIVVNDVLFSRLHSIETGKSLIEKLRLLVPSKMANKINIDAVPLGLNWTIDQHTESNIRLIEKTIYENNKNKSEEKRINFAMKGYGVYGLMKSVTDNNGNVRIYEILPLAIVEINKHCYMIGYKEGKKYASIYRIDLMFDLKTKVYDYVQINKDKEKLKNEIAHENMQSFVEQHLYASYGLKNTYRVRAKAINGAFTYVMDIVSPSTKLIPVKNNPEEAEFMITCPKRTMEIILRQYIGYLNVIGPDEAKKDVEKAVINTILEDERYKKLIIEKLIQDQELKINNKKISD